MSSTAPQLRSRLPRIAEVAVQRARLTVVPRTRTRPRAPRVPFVTLVSAILLAGVIGLLMFNTSMQQASFRAAALEDQASDLTAQEEGLRLELQELRNPLRVAGLAQRNGMVLPAGGPLVLDLDTGKVLGDQKQPILPGSKVPPTVPGPPRPDALDPDPIIVRERPANLRNNPRHGASHRARQR